MLKNFLGALCASIFLSQPSFAIKFSNQFTEFELPPRWQCALEGAEWVCQSTDDTKKRDAIIVLAAKIKGDLDTFDRYKQYLNGPRVFTAPNGTSIKSSPKYTKDLTLNNQQWVDSLHMESEVPGFYTRYLATVKQDIAVLVTYSINKNKYSEYQSQFEEMVKSLKVFRKAGTGINQLAGTSLFNQNTAALGTTSLFQPESEPSKPTEVAAEKPKAKKQSGGGDDLMIYGLLGAGAVGFIIWRKKQQG